MKSLYFDMQWALVIRTQDRVITSSAVPLISDAGGMDWKVSGSEHGNAVVVRSGLRSISRCYLVS